MVCSSSEELGRVRGGRGPRMSSTLWVWLVWCTHCTAHTICISASTHTNTNQFVRTVCVAISGKTSSTLWYKYRHFWLFLSLTSSIFEYIPLPGPTGPAVISNYAYIQNCFDSQSLFLKNILVSYHFSLNTSRSMQLLYGVFRLMQQLLDTSTAQNISHELTKAQNYHAQL